MDPKRLKEAYRRLEVLDERLTYKVRPRARDSLVATSADQLEGQLRDLAEYTVELKDVVRELFLAIASKPPAEKAAGDEPAEG